MVLGLIRKQEEAMEIIRSLKEAGRTNELAVEQLLAQLYQLKGLLPNIQQEIAENENRINFLIGRPLQKIKRRKEGQTSLPALISAAAIPAYVLERRPDIRAAGLELEASGFDVESARAAFLPGISLSGLLGTQAFRPGFLATMPSSLAYTALGTLTAPVFNRNALKAQLKTAKASQMMALEAYRKTVAASLAEISTELSRQKLLDESIALKQKEQEILESSILTSAELLKYGKATYLEILNAQQRLMNAKSEFIELGFQKKLSGLSLYKGLGGGW
jgi:outer membrane protein TolC